MNYISVFDLLKVGIGPSSSHTLGPWKAALAFIDELNSLNQLSKIDKISIDLYGSLALTGKGHGTDVAILMGLSGHQPETVSLDLVKDLPASVERENLLWLNITHQIKFNPVQHFNFHTEKRLPYHSNGMIFNAFDAEGNTILKTTYYSIGGGFVSKGEALEIDDRDEPTYYAKNAKTLAQLCNEHQMSISEIVMQNELCWHSKEALEEYLDLILNAMKESVFNGCHHEGILPGGLSVIRRAHSINKKLLNNAEYQGYTEWLEKIALQGANFSSINKWISAFAMAVNEENADFGRIVTAPTNGSAGVIPAVLHYLICFTDQTYTKEQLHQFLLVASQIGIFFKTNATISAAAGGCQAEIGVSSAMAAAALTEVLGGTVEQALAAAEIAMEHHLGLTCDPIGGLVQVPCIERNSMGAIKAILACNLALETDTKHSKVSLDDVIKTMWETAVDMHEKYKETSIGGLAINVALPEC